MIKLLEPMLAELQNEAATTRRVLDRVPAGRLTWQPHPHSMTVGQLAMHIALIPGNISKLSRLEQFDVSTAGFAPPQPSGIQEILAALDSGVAEAAAYLGGLSESEALANWTARAGPRELFTLPRVALLRTIMLNHWYHHRGQMSVYLRMLEVPVPSVYGPTYDENPFAAVSKAGTSA